MKKGRTATILSKTISALLHPVVVPVYMLALLMYGGLLLSYAGPQARLYFISVIVLNTVIVPAICILLFNRLRFWRENPDSDFRERILPMIVMLICYTACLIMIKEAPFAYPVKKMLQAGIGCVVFGLATTFFWPVSLHLIAQGAAVAFLGILVSSGAGNLIWVLCGSVALASSLASARLYLGRHDTAQVAAGFLGGFAITTLVIYLI